MHIRYLRKNYEEPLSVPEPLKDHPLFAGPGPVGIISADSPLTIPETKGGTQALAKELDHLGLKYEPTDGKYGNPESSFIVYNPTREQMIDLGRRYGQEGVVYTLKGRHQLIYTNGPNKGKHAPGRQGAELFMEPPPDYYTRIPNKGYMRLHFDHNNLVDDAGMTKSEQNMSKDLEVNEIRQMLAKSIKAKIDEYTDTLVELRKRELAKADALYGQPQIPAQEIKAGPSDVSGGPQEGLLSQALMGPGTCPLCGMEDKPGYCQCSPKGQVETNDPSLGDEPAVKGEMGMAGQGGGVLAMEETSKSEESPEASKLKEKDFDKKPVEVCPKCKSTLCKCGMKKDEFGLDKPATMRPADTKAASVQGGAIGGVAGIRLRAKQAAQAVSPGVAPAPKPVPAAPIASTQMRAQNAALVSPGPKAPVAKGEDFIDLKNASDSDKRLKEMGDNPGSMPKAGKKVKSGDGSGKITKGKGGKKSSKEESSSAEESSVSSGEESSPDELSKSQAKRQFDGNLGDPKPTVGAMESSKEKKPASAMPIVKPVKKADAGVPVAKPPTGAAPKAPAMPKPAAQSNPAAKPAAMPKPTLPGAKPTIPSGGVPAAKAELEKGVEEIDMGDGGKWTGSGLETGTNRPQAAGVPAVTGEATVKPIATGVVQHPTAPAKRPGIFGRLFGNK